jgi:hypothetical protein
VPARAPGDDREFVPMFVAFFARSRGLASLWIAMMEQDNFVVLTNLFYTAVTVDPKLHEAARAANQHSRSMRHCLDREATRV